MNNGYAENAASLQSAAGINTISRTAIEGLMDVVDAMMLYANDIADDAAKIADRTLGEALRNGEMTAGSPVPQYAGGQIGALHHHIMELKAAIRRIGEEVERLRAI